MFNFTIFRHAPSPSTTTVGEVSSNDQQAAARIQTTAIGGVLGAIIVILTSLLVLSLLGMLYLYIRMKTTEEVFTTRKRTLSRSACNYNIITFLALVIIITIFIDN